MKNRKLNCAEKVDGHYQYPTRPFDAYYKCEMGWGSQSLLNARLILQNPLSKANVSLIHF